MSLTNYIVSQRRQQRLRGAAKVSRTHWARFQACLCMKITQIELWTARTATQGDGALLPAKAGHRSAVSRETGIRHGYCEAQAFMEWARWPKMWKVLGLELLRQLWSLSLQADPSIGCTHAPCLQCPASCSNLSGAESNSISALPPRTRTWVLHLQIWAPKVSKGKRNALFLPIIKLKMLRSILLLLWAKRLIYRAEARASRYCVNNLRRLVWEYPAEHYLLYLQM